MKKLNTFLTILLIVFPLLLTAQQYDLSRETYKFNVKKLPKYFVEPEKRTYYVKIVQNGIKDYFNDEYISNEFIFPDWKEAASEKEAYLVITVAAPSITFAPYEFTNKRTEKETPDGLQITNRFTPILKYSLPIKCQFKCDAETFDRSSIVKTPSQMPTNVYEVSLDFPTKQEATDYVTQNKKSIERDIAKRVLNEMYKDAEQLFRERFLDSDGVEYITLNFLDAEKSLYKKMMTEAKTNIKEELDKITVSDSPLKTSPNLEHWVTQFQMVAADMDISKPEQKKAKEAMIKNLYYLLYVMEDLNNALMYAQILKDSFNSREAAKMIRDIRTLYSDLDKYHKESRHY